MSPEHPKALIAQAVDGDAAAWRALWSWAEPIAWGVTGKWQVLGPLCRSGDDRREVVLRVMERLRADDFRRLRGTLDAGVADDTPALTSWLRTVTTRVAIDYVRSRPEHLDVRARKERRWVTIVHEQELDSVALNLDPARLATARQLLDHARALLTHEQLGALVLWLDGADDAIIAERLRLSDAGDARRLLRAGLKRLRDRFRASSPDARKEEGP